MLAPPEQLDHRACRAYRVFAVRMDQPGQKVHRVLQGLREGPGCKVIWDRVVKLGFQVTQEFKALLG